MSCILQNQNLSPDLSDSEVRSVVLRLGAVQRAGVGAPGLWAWALPGLLGGGLIARALAWLKQHREPDKVAF